MVSINRIWFHYGRAHTPWSIRLLLAHVWCDLIGLVSFPLCVCDINSIQTLHREKIRYAIFDHCFNFSDRLPASTWNHRDFNSFVWQNTYIHAQTWDISLCFFYLIPCAGFFLFSIASCDNRFVYIIKSVWIKCSSHSVFNGTALYNWNAAQHTTVTMNSFES